MLIAFVPSPRKRARDIARLRPRADDWNEDLKALTATS